MKINSITRDKKLRTAFFIFFSLLALLILMSGCTEEKKEETPNLKIEPKFLGCQVLDKFPEDINKQIEVNFCGKIRLLGISANKNPESKSIEISYLWSVLQDISPYNKIFVHFTDSMGNILFQNDHDFCTDYSFHKKIENKFIKESFLIYIPKSFMETELDIKIGIYDPVNGKSCEIKSNGGLPVDYGNTASIIKKVL